MKAQRRAGLDASPTRSRKHPKVFDELYVQPRRGRRGRRHPRHASCTRLARLHREGDEAEAPGQGRDGLPDRRSSCIAIGVVVVVLLVKVIPVFEKMFKDFGGGALPGADADRHRHLARASSITAVHHRRARSSASIVGCRAVLRTPKGRAIVRQVMLLKAPVIGPVLRKVAVARFTRTLGTLLSSGVPILDALEIVAKTAGNVVVAGRASCTRAQKISEGKNMAEPADGDQGLPADGRADDRRRRADRRAGRDAAARSPTSTTTRSTSPSPR